jgi:hypothetical protein
VQPLAQRRVALEKTRLALQAKEELLHTTQELRAAAKIAESEKKRARNITAAQEAERSAIEHAHRKKSRELTLVKTHPVLVSQRVGGRRGQSVVGDTGCTLR